MEICGVFLVAPGKPQDCWWRILSVIGNETPGNCLIGKLGGAFNRLFYFYP